MLTKVDIKGGKLTFRQRISLGEILTSGESEYEIFESCLLCLHKDIEVICDIWHVKYFQEITEGVNEWMEKERILLHYEPSQEEISAGIKDLSEKIGEYGTIKSIAKSFHTDPDIVLDWEYGKVFGILWSDLEEYKYMKRYNKQLERKYKK